MVERSSREKEYREVLVVPLAARREALALMAVISLIILLMGLRFSLLTSTDDAVESLQPYQMSDMNLKNQAPTLYRALLGVVGDVLDLREETGSWPEVAQLKSEDLPPFAGAFLPMGLRGFVWERHAGEGWVDYFGVNADVGSEEKKTADPLENSFILRIIDLQSGEHPHPHSGTHNESEMRFTSQVWINPQVTDYPSGGNLVQRGWKWIVGAGTP